MISKVEGERELERTFLLGGRPEGELKKKKHLLQRYPVIGSDGSESRLRQSTNLYPGTSLEKTFALDFKTGGTANRGEEGTKLDADQFLPLWRFATEHGVGKIEKVRSTFDIGDGLEAEVDGHLGRHRGLWVVEVEFETPEELSDFAPLDWFGMDPHGFTRGDPCNPVFHSEETQKQVHCPRPGENSGGTMASAGQ